MASEYLFSLLLVTVKKYNTFSLVQLWVCVEGWGLHWALQKYSQDVSTVYLEHITRKKWCTQNLRILLKLNATTE